MSPGLRISPAVSIDPPGTKPPSKHITIKVPEGYNDDPTTETATVDPSIADTADMGEGSTVNRARKNWTLEVNTPVYYERKMTVSRKMRHDSFMAW